MIVLLSTEASSSVVPWTASASTISVPSMERARALSFVPHSESAGESSGSPSGEVSVSRSTL